MEQCRIVSVVGNPKPASRTRQVAEAVAERVAAALDASGLAAQSEVIEVSELGAGLLGWGDPTVAQALTTTKKEWAEEKRQ